MGNAHWVGPFWATTPVHKAVAGEVRSGVARARVQVRPGEAGQKGAQGGTIRRDPGPSGQTGSEPMNPFRPRAVHPKAPTPGQRIASTQTLVQPSPDGGSQMHPGQWQTIVCIFALRATQCRCAVPLPCTLHPAPCTQCPVPCACVCPQGGLPS